MIVMAATAALVAASHYYENHISKDPCRNSKLTGKEYIAELVDDHLSYCVSINSSFQEDNFDNIMHAGLTLGPVILVVATVIIIKCYHGHSFDKIEREYQVKIDKFLQDYEVLRPTRYSYEDIKRMTNQFKDMLGKGGYGIVYKGMIGKEILVAVKILDNSKGKGEDFTNEVGTIGRFTMSM
ncbi:hypothetical protein GIB67_030414 [Kingdonia uniflora]|uniref:Uncharacterized protein n=1 Tax=Kingdonia uniflora TaxID=39325 RepID=A0A7J7NE32_9MAGN|nr:hypothetical protein GIB67_030414 [Kingdonia uniflora]